MNFLTAITAFLGAIFAMFLGTHVEGFSSFVIPFTAGGFIYIATADLIPELKKETAIRKSIYQLASILAGVLIMWALKLAFE